MHAGMSMRPAAVLLLVLLGCETSSERDNTDLAERARLMEEWQRAFLQQLPAIDFSPVYIRRAPVGVLFSREDLLAALPELSEAEQYKLLQRFKAEDEAQAFSRTYDQLRGVRSKPSPPRRYYNARTDQFSPDIINDLAPLHEPVVVGSRVVDLTRYQWLRQDRVTIPATMRAFLTRTSSRTSTSLPTRGCSRPNSSATAPPSLSCERSTARWTSVPSSPHC